MRVPESLTSNHIHAASTFGECLEQQFALCQELEILADSLPLRVDTHAATVLSNRIHVTLRRCHRMEETVIFPDLLVTSPEMPLILDRLRLEHLEDQDHACDVRDAVSAFVAGQKRNDAEELGYMLRGLFVSLRRHLAFDRDHLLPLYRLTRRK